MDNTSNFITHLYNPLFKCKKCQNCLSEPRICSKCGEFYCFSCFQYLKECLECHVYPIQDNENQTLNKLMHTIEYTCSNCKKSFSHKDIKAHSKQCKGEQLKCSFCLIKGTEEEIWAHLITTHKKDIMSTHSSNFLRTYTNIETKTDYEAQFLNQHHPQRQSPTHFATARNVFNYQINVNVNGNKSNDIKKDDIENINDKLEKLGYCNQRNIDGKLCSHGNLLCKDCMTKIKQALGLKRGELINKAGKISRYVNYYYHCGENYTTKEKAFDNEITHNNICDAVHASCDNCAPLNVYVKKYLSIAEDKIRIS